MNILLADDERMVRMGLQSMLEELYPNMFFYIHAKNGKEVIDAVRENKIDIAFLDVKMPEMNGLDALAACKSISETTTWIILSGYADFEYARKAVSLSAFEYLLKPVDIHVLDQLLRKLLQMKEMNQKQDNDSFAHDVIRSFNMADQFGSEDTEFEPAKEDNYIIYMIYINKTEKNTQHVIKQFLHDNLVRFCKSRGEIYNFCLFFNNTGALCLIASTAENSFLSNYLGALYAQEKNCAFTVFYGKADTIYELYRISQRISRVAGVRILYEYMAPVLVSNVEVMPNLSDQLQLSADIEAVAADFYSHNIGMLKDVLTHMRENSVYPEIYMKIDRNAPCCYLSNIFYMPDQCSNFHEFIDLLMTDSNQIPQFGESGAGDEMDRIRKFVYENYAGDVSISYVSECFNISPSYLSRLFHEKTGQKFINFVTEVRMEAAKKMILSQKNKPVKEVASEVGYSSVRHFSKTFQRYTGCLPSEYYAEKNV